MADRPVLDTDVLIDYLRGRGPGYELLKRLGDPSAYRVTAISAFELALGRSYGLAPEPVDALIATTHLPLTKIAALRAGGLLRELLSRGQGIEIRDAMQAGICLDAGVPLMTRNVKHFDRIEGLEVLTP